MYQIIMLYILNLHNPLYKNAGYIIYFIKMFKRNNSFNCLRQYLRLRKGSINTICYFLIHIT